MAMTKAEIIANVVNDFACLRSDCDSVSGADEGYSEEEIIAILETSLRKVSPDELVRTCADFNHFAVECCHLCHRSYPHLELALIDVESGGSAWICCALDRALNPEKTAQRESSPEWKEIQRLFNSDVVD